MDRDRTYEMLRDALAKPGCALCRLEKEHVQRYLDGFMYEDVTDVGLRAKMRAAHGFCYEHALQAIAVRDALGLAIIYQDILSSVDKEMLEGLSSPRLSARRLLSRESPAPGQAVARHIAAHRSCPACAVRSEINEAGLRSLAAHVLEPEMAAAHQASNGLCLPHFRQLMGISLESAALEALVRRQSEVINGLTAEMGEFIRKHDHRFRHEAMGSERDSWHRAMSLIVGELPPL